VKKRTVYVVRGEDGQARDLVVGREGETLVVTFAGAVERFGVATLPDGRLSLVFEDGRHVCARGRAGADGFVELSDFRGRRKVAIAEPLRDRMRHAASSAASAASEAEIRALMPGRVVEVKVTPDDRVEPGALLLVLEAMGLALANRFLRTFDTSITHVITVSTFMTRSHTTLLPPVSPRLSSHITFITTCAPAHTRMRTSSHTHAP
jgi:acetyl/propionyl-CoA carboxylase alpha subunit